MTYNSPSRRGSAGSVALPSPHARRPSSTMGGQQEDSSAARWAAIKRGSAGTNPVKLVSGWIHCRRRAGGIGPKQRRLTWSHLGQDHKRWDKVSSHRPQWGHRVPPGAHLLATNWVTVPPVMRSLSEEATSSANLPDFNHRRVRATSMP